MSLNLFIKIADAIKDYFKNSVQNKIRAQEQIHKRLDKAIADLSHDKDTKRMASFDALHRIADDIITQQLEPDVQKYIFEPLCAHLRRTTKDEKYIRSQPSEPTEEIQKLLSVLFNPSNPLITLIKTRERVDLTKCHLNGANLQYAILEGVNLKEAHLKEARLQNAKLQYAILEGAHLQKAKLQYANLGKTFLNNAKLQEANLQGVILKFENQLKGAILQRADLREANLQEVDLHDVDLIDADLRDADLQNADLRKAILQRVKLKDADLLNAKIDNDAIITMPSNWQEEAKPHPNAGLGAITGALLYEGDEFIKYL